MLQPRTGCLKVAIAETELPGDGESGEEAIVIESRALWIFVRWLGNGFRAGYRGTTTPDRGASWLRFGRRYGSWW